MTHVLTHPELQAVDKSALSDLVRFGIMADDQLARRYADPTSAFARLLQLNESGIVRLCSETLEGADVYEPTRLAAILSEIPTTRLRRINRNHVSHDIGVVDLADYLLAHDPTVRWVTESELRLFLDQIAPSPRRLRGDTRHRPDGLLLSNTKRIGIELEHSDKYQKRYRDISDWFVREWRVDSVRWYVDNPRIRERLRLVNSQHGFDRDMQVEIEEFPPGVRLRQPPGRYRP
jgi:hypothetical protein